MIMIIMMMMMMMMMIIIIIIIIIISIVGWSSVTALQRFWVLCDNIYECVKVVTTAMACDHLLRRDFEL
jgi:hypothetical protein